VTVGTLGLVGVSVVSVVASSGEITSASDDRTVARIAAIAVVFSLILGTVVSGAEGTHGTITQTFLVAPVRERVLAAKAVVAVALGVVLGALAEVLTLAVAVPGASLSLHNARYVLVGVLIGCAATGAIGVGLGAIFHRQGPAIVVALVWLLIGESVLAIGLRDNVKYLPGHVVAGAVAGTRGSSGSDLLGAWAGVAGSALYAAGFLVAGGALLSRRDV
jgi:ABC-type transport system involved in multi-copper enzyme maturation permease subunit